MQSEREQLQSLSIPLGAVAALAEVKPQTISLYFSDPDRVPMGIRFIIQDVIKQAIRTEQAVRAELATLLPTEFARALGINWKSPSDVRALIKHLEYANV